MAARRSQDDDSARGATPASVSGLSGAESDASGEQQWWLPQPHASLDEAHTEWRPAVPLAEALQCTVCRDLLKEAITAVECSHSYCYDCIDSTVTVGGRANVCPVCKVLLGPNPWEHNKLKYDFMLDSIVRKVFPRPKLDEALEARRLEREEATRQAKASLRKNNRGFARVGSAGQLGMAAGAAGGGGGGSSVPIAASAAALEQQQQKPIPAAAMGPAIQLGLFPLQEGQPGSDGDGGEEQLAPLPKPYLRVPVGVTLSVLKAWLVDRLVGKKGDPAKLPEMQLSCGGRTVAATEEGSTTVAQLHERCWLPYVAAQAAAGQPPPELMLVYYAAVPDEVPDEMG